jgi:uncharacterized membrane protein
MDTLYAVVIMLIVYAGLETAWLSIMKNYFYDSAFAKFTKDKLEIRSYLAIALLYVIIVFSLVWLVILPIIKEKPSLPHAFMRGAIFGIVVYGVYNLTNMATIKGYPWNLVIVDTAWGTCLFAILAIVFHVLKKSIKI